MKRILIASLLIALAVVAAASGYAWLRYREVQTFADTPYPMARGSIVVEVPRGLSMPAIAGTLLSANVISDADAFVWLARIEDQANSVQAGEYEFRTPATPRRVLRALATGAVLRRSFTIPEGYNLEQIAGVIEKAEIGSADSVRAATTNPKAAAAFGIDADSLEGYLFPDTYHYTKETTVREAVGQMVSRFQAVFDSTFEERADMAGFTRHEVVTLASIVEKETGRASERPLVASVFLNRLKRGMPLQADPTVIYGIADFNGNITRKDLRTDTPYNTYVNPGLPPGPICSPGEGALKAVLWPKQTRYLYFVAKNDGGHHFSVNYREHAAAVRRYQLGR